MSVHQGQWPLSCLVCAVGDPTAVAATTMGPSVSGTDHQEGLSGDPERSRTPDRTEKEAADEVRVHVGKVCECVCGVQTCLPL